MRQIAILTATYNHPDELRRLRDSLLKQDDRDFFWLVVDDGSKVPAERAVRAPGIVYDFEVEVLQQKNGGKARAVNCGLDRLAGAEFILIVDDDEQLAENAVSVLRAYVEKYRDTDCGVIHFNRADENGKPIIDPFIPNDYYMPYQQSKRLKRHADGYIGYFTEKLGDERFPVFEGEKYVGPSVLFMKVTEHSQLLWAPTILGQTEYLEGGITKQGRRLRIRNPHGMIWYCSLFQTKEAGLRNRFVYSVHGYAYLKLAGLRRKNVEAARKLNPLCALPGMALAALWKRKYGV